MSPLAIGSAGGGQAHENRSPFLVMNYIIAMQGIFPSRN
jgi:microcystin-dependent protein